MPRTDVVCDASALVELLIGGDRGVAIAELLADAVVHAPHLALFEVVQTIRNFERESDVSSQEALQAVSEALRVEVLYWAMYDVADRVWALRHNLTAYDASYVALAERLEAKLITVDERLACASGPRCEFIVP